MLVIRSMAHQRTRTIVFAELKRRRHVREARSRRATKTRQNRVKSARPVGARADHMQVSLNARPVELRKPSQMLGGHLCARHSRSTTTTISEPLAA